MLSASTLSAALLLLPRSSPDGVGTGVAVGLGAGLGLGVGFTAYAVGKNSKQTSATAIRVIADAKLRENFASRCFRTRRTEVWIGVFICFIDVVFVFLVFAFGCLPFAICSRKFGTKFPKILERPDF